MSFNVYLSKKPFDVFIETKNKVIQHEYSRDLKNYHQSRLFKESNLERNVKEQLINSRKYYDNTHPSFGKVQQKRLSSPKTKIIPVPNSNKERNETLLINSPKTYTQPHLGSPLKMEKKKPNPQKFNELITSYHQQIQNLEYEHKLRLKKLKEEHNQRIDSLKRDMTREAQFC
mmetsp:Transcript_6920/g.10122  ORF Transcript_6920/g.10122 Transcript_6920/m.10122 type:complete len:173 (+) Transcript_6920:1-519(+)